MIMISIIKINNFVNNSVLKTIIMIITVMILISFF